MLFPHSILAAGLSLVALTAPVRAAKKVTVPDLSTYTNIFAFGDSYSAYGYGQNRPLTPADRVGLNYAGGPTWIEYLGNQTVGGQDGVWNLAQGGATINGSIVNSGYATVQDFSQQVQNFMTDFYYGDMADWNPSTTLFSVWFGTNDCILPLVYNISAIPYLDVIFGSFNNDIAVLYNSGARHFLMPNLASLQYTPHAMARDAVGLKALYKDQVNQWNAAYKILVKKTLPSLFPNATFQYVDVYTLMEPVMKAPHDYGFKGLGYCPTFGQLVDVDDPFQTAPGCKYSLNFYAWWNDFHLSSTAHALLADYVAGALRGQPSKRAIERSPKMRTEKRGKKELGWHGKVHAA